MFRKKRSGVEEQIFDAESSKSNQNYKRVEYKDNFFPAKPTYSLPIIGVRKTLLSNYRVNSYNMCRQLRRDYHLALFKASIKALNCDVVEIEANASYSDYKNISRIDYPYVRDPAVVFHDKHLIISTYGNEKYRSKDIIKKIKKMTGYMHWSINNAYFEGGNLFYVPSLEVVLHGIHPGGHYAKKSKLEFLTSQPEDYYKVDPVQTNQRLKKILGLRGIDVLGLALHPDVLTYDNSETREHFYYHLDCFMQVMPDGRLIILNKKILSEADQLRLQHLFGDKFIDLAYPDYLTNPVIFNFIAIPNEDSFTLISPTLPDSVLEGLAKLGLSLITPESLDAEHARYDKEHAKKVAEILRSEGYVDANAVNLATHLAPNIHGYRLDNGKRLNFAKIENMGKKMSDKMDNCYRKKGISFVYGGGGPHCFTTEIVPTKAIGANQLKRPKQNDCAFFNMPKDPSIDQANEVQSMDLRPDF